jgi:hypothetical protein
MTVKDLVVQKLTTFNVAADGTSCCMNFISADGDQTCICLATECLAELLMTLPRMIRQALRVRYRNESLRLAYQAGDISIDQSSDPKITIVTLATPDGFEVSFGLTREQMMVFEAATEALEWPGHHA